MSLKVFHVFFIALAILCTLGFAAWTRVASLEGAVDAIKVAGIVSGVLGVGLLFYVYWFVTKKAKRIIV